MKVILIINGKQVELNYHNSLGSLESAKEVETNKPITIQTSYSGVGYATSHENGLLSMPVCDARYVRLMELKAFVPRLIFIME